MTQAELVQMLISKSNAQTETIKCLKIELEEAQAVNREQRSTQRTITNALSVAKGGFQVRKQNQSTVEMLRLAIQGLVDLYGLSDNEQLAFAKRVYNMTETEVSF